MVLAARQEAGGTEQNQGMAQVQLQQIRGQRCGKGCKDPGSGTALRRGAWEPWGSSFTVYSANGSPSLGPDSTPLSDKRAVGLEFPSTLLIAGTQCSTCASPAEERASQLGDCCRDAGKGRSANKRQKSCAQRLPGVASMFPLGPTSSHQGRCL